MANLLKVLVVDDSAIYRSLVQGCLRDLPDLRCVGTAHDGSDAIAKAAELSPDLILLDVEMPRVDGFSACRALRTLPDTRVTPIIMVTSRTEPTDVEAGFACGCTDFIGKPVDEMELAAKVESWVAASGADGGDVS
jgi:CheY-like chemotaxis protein